MPIHIIDDNTSISEFIEELLEACSEEILCFHSAEEYLLYRGSYRYLEPKLIISDVVMGGMDGFDLIKNLQTKGLKAKVIIMSGFNTRFNEPCHKVDCILIKPFHPEKLITVASQLLGQG